MSLNPSLGVVQMLLLGFAIGAIAGCTVGYFIGRKAELKAVTESLRKTYEEKGPTVQTIAEWIRDMARGERP